MASRPTLTEDRFSTLQRIKERRNARQQALLASEEASTSPSAAWPLVPTVFPPPPTTGVGGGVSQYDQANAPIYAHEANEISSVQPSSLSLVSQDNREDHIKDYIICNPDELTGQESTGGPRPLAHVESITDKGSRAVYWDGSMYHPTTDDPMAMQSYKTQQEDGNAGREDDDGWDSQSMASFTSTSTWKLSRDRLRHFDYNPGLSSLSDSKPDLNGASSSPTSVRYSLQPPLSRIGPQPPHGHSPSASTTTQEPPQEVLDELNKWNNYHSKYIYAYSFAQAAVAMELKHSSAEPNMSGNTPASVDSTSYGTRMTSPSALRPSVGKISYLTMTSTPSSTMDVRDRYASPMGLARHESPKQSPNSIKDIAYPSAMRRHSPDPSTSPSPTRGGYMDSASPLRHTISPSQARYITSPSRQTSPGPARNIQYAQDYHDYDNEDDNEDDNEESDYDYPHRRSSRGSMGHSRRGSSIYRRGDPSPQRSSSNSRNPSPYAQKATIYANSHHPNVQGNTQPYHPQHNPQTYTQQRYLPPNGEAGYLTHSNPNPGMIPNPNAGMMPNPNPSMMPNPNPSMMPKGSHRPMVGQPSQSVVSPQTQVIPQPMGLTKLPAQSWQDVLVDLTAGTYFYKWTKNSKRQDNPEVRFVRYDDPSKSITWTTKPNGRQSGAVKLAEIVHFSKGPMAQGHCYIEFRTVKKFHLLLSTQNMEKFNRWIFALQNIIPRQFWSHAMAS